MYQIRCNKGTEFPSQHIAVAVSEQHSLDGGITGHVRKVMQSGQAIAWRMSTTGPSRERRLSFTHKGEFWRWLECQLNPKLGTWLWADDLQRTLWLLGVGEELDSNRLVYKGWILGNNVSFCKCETGRGKITMVDRCNWWRCSLNQFIMSHLSINKPCDFCDNDNTKGDGTVFHTIFAIKSAVTQLCKFIHENDLGVLKITAAGQSLAAYRHRFGPRRNVEYISKQGKNKGKLMTEQRLWPMLHRDESALALERTSYYGGPTHCYYIGHVDTPINVLDTRSIYPSVMLTNEYPVELLDCQCECGIEECQERIEHEGCIAHVKIHSETTVYPVKRKNDVMYVRGRFQTDLAGPELKFALANGHVEKIYSCNWYRMMPIFGKFVKEMYELREQYELMHNSVWADLCKLILNSLGSKFGQTTGEWRDMPDMPCETPWGYWHVRNADDRTDMICRGISNNTQVKADKKEAAHSFPAIPAYMCSYARVKMNVMINDAKTCGRVYYSAVDSIHCSQQARDRLWCMNQIGPGLGQLREKTIASQADYYGVGHYSLDGNLTQSGLPEMSRPACRHCKMVMLEESTTCQHCGKPWDGYTWWWLEKDCVAAAINRGPASEVVDTNVIVSLENKYKFGKIGLDGWVTPFYIDNNDSGVAITLESLTEHVPF